MPGWEGADCYRFSTFPPRPGALVDYSLRDPAVTVLGFCVGTCLHYFAGDRIAAHRGSCQFHQELARTDEPQGNSEYSRLELRELEQTHGW
jgi:hypothetical protein